MQDFIKVTKNTETSTEGAQKKKSKKIKGNRFMVLAVVGGLLLASLGAAGYFYSKYNQVKSNPAQAVQTNNAAETSRVLDKLKTRILITDTTAPTVARIEDTEKLKASNPDFYKDIQKGDYLVIYPRRAMVFRESNEQVINVAPIINTADIQAKAAGNASSSNSNQ